MSNNQQTPQTPPKPPYSDEDKGQSRDIQQTDPEKSGSPAPLQPNMNDQRELRASQTLIMVANIAGPVSLFIGGMLLGTAGLVCAIIACRKLRRLMTKQDEIARIAARLKRASFIGMGICGVAIVLNGISMYFMYPVILEMLQTGDYSGLTGSAGGGAGTSSTWG